MLRHASFATWFVTAYLVVYVIFLWSGSAFLRQVAFGMFLASPVFVIWLVYAVIRHGGPGLRELGPDEEYGYGDKRL
jgi:membrane protein implicated in regulation of membrane protease activity